VWIIILLRLDIDSRKYRKMDFLLLSDGFDAFAAGSAMPETKTDYIGRYRTGIWLTDVMIFYC